MSHPGVQKLQRRVTQLISPLLTGLSLAMVLEHKPWT